MRSIFLTLNHLPRHAAPNHERVISQVKRKHKINEKKISKTKYKQNYKLICTQFFMNILFPTELHLKNVYYLYSACSNPTNVVLVIVLSMIIGKGLDNATAKFYRCVITQAITKTITYTGWILFFVGVSSITQFIV